MNFNLTETFLITYLVLNNEIATAEYYAQLRLRSD